MNDHDFQRPSIDDAIDTAVRDLMHRDPRPGLRRRVLAKLDEPARRAAWRWMLAPAGVLASLLVAVVLFNANSPEVPVTTTSASPPATVPAPAQPVSVPAVVQPEPARPESRPAQRARANQGSHIFGSQTNRVSAASVRANDRAAVIGDNLPSPPVEVGLPQLSLTGLEIRPLQLPALAPRR